MSTLDTSSTVRPSLRMSEAEYERWGLEHESCEWVDGEVILKMAVEENHDEIQAIIRGVMEHFVRRHKLGKVRGPEFTTRMKLAKKTVRRDPDVMFVATANVPRLLPTYLDGPADLVVEIVSAESEFRDFNEKYFEYQEAGVREYWIVNPLGKTMHLFVRDAGTSEFVRREANTDGRFCSVVIDGLWFHPDDLFAVERPDVVMLLRKIDPALIA